MERIASFCVDHNKLEPGIYLSRIDGDIITYDIRLVKPNTPPYLPNPVMHTIEHLFATFARNSAEKDSVIYFGPMGCRTGFYFLLRNVEKARAVELIREIFQKIAPEECGNYQEHDLPGALEWARNFLPVIADWDETRLAYQA